jgi:hypothetical protein
MLALSGRICGRTTGFHRLRRTCGWGLDKNDLHSVMVTIVLDHCAPLAFRHRDVTASADAAPNRLRGISVDDGGYAPSRPSHLALGVSASVAGVGLEAFESDGLDARDGDLRRNSHDDLRSMKDRR